MAPPSRRPFRAASKAGAGAATVVTDDIGTSRFRAVQQGTVLVWVDIAALPQGLVAQTEDPTFASGRRAPHR